MRLLCDRYETADPSERFHLEKRYGKKVIATAIEESKTDAWMKTNTKPCPSCDSSIEVMFREPDTRNCTANNAKCSGFCLLTSSGS